MPAQDDPHWPMTDRLSLAKRAKELPVVDEDVPVCGGWNETS
ncbi:hypothetical protein RMSM_03138 [Rhodopirellula maiorica SM1]|uniref:Uncharacterized protein n=1 Tax=Rhodopirellula maiorica SM1 TaxID=1265738 RepID=M5RKT3_9BACT|nr:hypothetical protein RMSM_03138 [Rhodopirellula maiorica SM1]